MRRALTWLAGAVGLAALARILSRRRAANAVAGPDPADELRRKLADRRREGGDAETVEVVAPEPDPDAGDPAGPVDLEERRARVHARAQEAIELMSDGAPADGPEGDTRA